MTCFTPAHIPETVADMAKVMVADRLRGRPGDAAKLIELGFDRDAVKALYDAADEAARALLAQRQAELRQGIG